MLFELLKLFWFPISVLIGHIILSLFFLNIYVMVPWLDKPIHFLGGFSIAYSLNLFIIYLNRKNFINRIENQVLLVLVFSLVTTAAVFWEFAEFLVDQFLGMNTQLSLSDTINDLFLGVLGGFTMVIYYGCNMIKKYSVQK